MIVVLPAVHLADYPDHAPSAIGKMFVQPIAVFDQFAVHQGDLRCGSAKAEHANVTPSTRRSTDPAAIAGAVAG